ncbi:MAG: murein hydrolase activator EnvC family protein [Huintestinicola sp.]
MKRKETENVRLHKLMLKNRTAAMFAAFIMAGASIPAMSISADYADDIAQLEQKREELAAERAAAEASLREYENNAAEQEEYLRIYDEKMRLQEEEISNVEEQIRLLKSQISDLEIQITDKEAEVQEGIEDFKERLRIMYMTSNDSIASMLVGATDFYDILARLELVERISKHDNDMIDDLTNKIKSLNEDKTALEEKKVQTEIKRAEEEEILAELRVTYQNHQETKEWYENQAAMDRARTEEMDAQDAQYEEELQAYIRKQQEELERKRQEEEQRKREEEERRKKEEEERRKKEEEERRRLEEEARQQAEQNGETFDPNSVDYSSIENQEDYSNDESTEDDYSSPGYSETGFIWPCPSVRNYTDVYGSRYIQETGKNEFHKGLDITKPGCAGEPIVASAAGTVITASNTGNGYGIHVVIDHGDKISTLYGHMSSTCVSVGDYVSQGQTIGYIGCTGYAFGNHLHFEVRVNGSHTDPFNYVSVNN